MHAINFQFNSSPTSIVIAMSVCPSLSPSSHQSVYTFLYCNNSNKFNLEISYTEAGPRNKDIDFGVKGQGQTDISCQHFFEMQYLQRPEDFVLVFLHR